MKIAIFASGSGSNAQRITEYFADNQSVSIELFLTNNHKAEVIERGRKLHIPTLIFDKYTFSNTKKILTILQKQEIDLIILAGFLWLIPEYFVKAYPNKIINIHPSLLPKYGGKGMWGHFVHEAVVANRDTQSGITIHYVNEHYDEGRIIFQASCDVFSTDTPEDVARKVQTLEHRYFPKVIEELIININNKK